MSRVCRISEFAERIGRSASTVRRRGAEGRIAARRTPISQGYLDVSDVRAVFTLGFARDDRRVVVYCRVSSAGQRDDLASRRAGVETYGLRRYEKWMKADDLAGGRS